MAKNRFFIQTASSMSPAHPYTIVAPDDDDGDICPVCDGECTCHKAAPAPSSLPIRNTTGPLSMSELSMRYTAQSSPSCGPVYPPSTVTPMSTPTPAPKPSLKIKFTVPSSMIAKQRPPTQPIASTSTSTKKSFKSIGETTSDFVNDGYNSLSDVQPFMYRTATPPRPAPKKRGRPPKALVAARKTTATMVSKSPYKPLNPKSAPPGKQKARSSLAAKNRVRQNLKARATQKAGKRKTLITTEEESSSALSDVDMDARRPFNNFDADSVHFPTFVSASALSSMSSDGSDSSLTDFDSDSSIEAEEEDFIISSVHDKARLRRELLGGDDASMQKKRMGHNNEWVIRPRKQSVGPSDAEMDVDSDATEDEDEDEDGDDEDNAEEDEDATTDAAVIGIGMSMEEDEEETDETNTHRYVGLATGWSEDDEQSSFDADLFFANLSDSDGNLSDSSSCTNPSRIRRLGPPFAMSMGEDGDQSDVSLASEDTEGDVAARRRRSELESLPFEVAESWDGQVVFTNGVHDNQGIVDLAFEAETERFLVDTSPSPSQDGNINATDTSPRRRKRAYMNQVSGLGIGMSDADNSDTSDSDGGYLEEDVELEGEGDTTDEELVGENDLPNERAMALFHLPPSVSAINPLSTVSPVVGGVRRRCQDPSLERRRRKWGMESPRAADILAGRVPFWDSEEEAELAAENESSVRGRSLVRGGGAKPGENVAKRLKTPTGPRRGVFSPSIETKQAIIGEDKNGVEVPSPHPRFKGRRRSAAGRLNAVEHLLRRHLLQSMTSSSLSNSVVSVASANSTNDPLSPMTDARSPLQLLLSSTTPGSSISMGSVTDDMIGTSLSTSSDVHRSGEAEPIQLHDVLEASFLDDSARDSSSALSSEEGGAASTKHLNRWDVISVGAFRQTRENGWDGRHTPISSADFGNAIKSSPLSSMLWQNSGLSTTRPASAPNTIKGSKLAKRRRLMMSASSMSSPLILPLSGDRTPNATPSSSTSLTKHTPNTDDSKNHHQHQQKSRKELRRENKLKRKGYSAAQQQHSHHPSHQFHSHHHHPNTKTRGTGSSQRQNFFSVSVPPLNL